MSNTHPNPAEGGAKKDAPAHTPGPWSPGCFVNPENKCQCSSILCEAYAGSICTVSINNGKSIEDGGNDAPPIDEARANARLIASAPELLAFAKWAVDQFCGDSGTGYTHWEENAQFMAGMKAIEKAEAQS